jgi:aspartate aminotransferase-like enzyme
VSEKAWAAVGESTLPRFYFDFKAARKTQAKKTPETPFTPAITLVQGLNKAIEMMREEGLDSIQARHELFAKATQAAVEALGLEFFAADRSKAFVTTSVVAPQGIDSGDIVRTLRNEFGVFIAGGQGKLKGKIFRLGHVGYFDPFDITTQVAALELGLDRLGCKVDIGAGVTAALKVLSEGSAG